MNVLKYSTRATKPVSIFSPFSIASEIYDDCTKPYSVNYVLRVAIYLWCLKQGPRERRMFRKRAKFENLSNTLTPSSLNTFRTCSLGNEVLHFKILFRTLHLSSRIRRIDNSLQYCNSLLSNDKSRETKKKKNIFDDCSERCRIRGTSAMTEKEREISAFTV